MAYVYYQEVGERNFLNEAVSKPQDAHSALKFC